jgi:hypothetical protein
MISGISVFIFGNVSWLAALLSLIPENKNEICI